MPLSLLKTIFFLGYESVLLAVQCQRAQNMINHREKGNKYQKRLIMFSAFQRYIICYSLQQQILTLDFKNTRFFKRDIFQLKTGTAMNKKNY